MRQYLCTICTNCDCHCHTVHTLITGLKQLWWGADVTGHYAHNMSLQYCVFNASEIVQSFLFCVEYLYHFRLSSCWTEGHHLVYIVDRLIFTSCFNIFHSLQSYFYMFFYCMSDFVILLVLLCSEQIIQMDDDSCVLKYIDIVPLDNNAQQFEDVKPFQVKVCIVTKLVV